MTKIIAIASQKGGVGKTTISLQTAYYISEKLDKSVLIIDMDMQGNTSSCIALPDPDTDENDFGDTTKAADLFQPNLAEIKLYQRPGSKISLIHTPKNCPNMAEAERLRMDDVLRPREYVRQLAKDFDYVLVDCPPSLGHALIAGLTMATHVVCPVKLSGFALTGLEGLLRTIIGVRDEYNPNLNIVGIVVNDMDTKSVSHAKAYEKLMSGLGELVLENKIMHRPPLDTATSEGMPVWSYHYAHVAAKEVMATIEEILEKAV
ncbi:ParA family protein [Thalassolituus marinus]|uniref:ParA family protein n=1 Tax=Thalassolituus marinus TaxID=671053 RepID=A0ABS7ZW18_9GAMM|nr:ParA family protein [Thalassolituus marinus]MCA6065418.1 ParA family protein [Thalassolituus marinus]